MKKLSIYPKPKKITAGEGNFSLNGAYISAPEQFSAAAWHLRKLINNMHSEFLELKKQDMGGIVFKFADINQEEYRILVTKEGVEILASDISGAMYATATLAQLIQNDGDFLCIPAVTIEDSPYKKYRCAHVFVPAREGIESFKRLLDTLCFLKYNTLIIEVGGGMEYERHPEVNRAWEWFCDKANNNFPGGPRNLQWADRYWKDSTHTEIAGGKWLLKTEMKDIVDYAKARGLNVIPEIQALSHCYYLTLANRDIAELQDDPFPDTYCPMNEESYKLYFDVADEVIEVFDPEIVSVGHDEIRILGECPRCQGKPGHELLAYELNRLYDYYKSRNIKMAMWGEKLQLFTSFDGIPRGGGLMEKTDHYGRHWRVLATHEAIDMIPRDILMLDWYHSMSHETQDCFIERDMDVIYGNFHGSMFGGWDERSKKVLGAEVSSWCLADEPTFARDGIMYELMFSAALLWEDDYSDKVEQDTIKRLLKATPAVRSVARGRTSPLYQGGSIELIYKGDAQKSTVRLPIAESVDGKVNEILRSLEGLEGVPVDTGHIYLTPNTHADSLVFIQACSKAMEYLPSYEFPPSKTWEIATYAVFYEDGSLELVNAHYGIQCADINMSWSRERIQPFDQVDEIDDEIFAKAEVIGESPYFKLEDKWRESAFYHTTPIRSGEQTVYAYEWINPNPSKKITAIKAINTTRDKEQSALLFALAAIKL